MLSKFFVNKSIVSRLGVMAFGAPQRGLSSLYKKIATTKMLGPVNAHAFYGTFRNVRSSQEEGGSNEVSSRFKPSPFIQRINDTSNFDEVLGMIASELDTISSEDFAQSLRSLTRSMFRYDTNDVRRLKKSEDFLKIVDSVGDKLDQIEHFNYTDVLGFLRKLREEGMINKVPQEKRIAFFKKIDHYVDQLDISDNSMKFVTNVFVEQSTIDTSGVAGNKLRLLLESLDEKTTSNVMNLVKIIRAIGQSQNSRQYMGLSKKVESLLSLNYDLLPLKTQTRLFRIFAELEEKSTLKYPLIETLLSSFNGKVENFEESDVINVLNGYKLGKSSYNTKLLNQINDMLFVTLEHNPESIETPFLLNYLSLNRGFRKLSYRLSDDALKAAFKVLEDRAESIPYLSPVLVTNAAKGIDLIKSDSGIEISKLVAKIMESFKQNIRRFAPEDISNIKRTLKPYITPEQDTELKDIAMSNINMNERYIGNMLDNYVLAYKLHGDNEIKVKLEEMINAAIDDPKVLRFDDVMKFISFYPEKLRTKSYKEQVEKLIEKNFTKDKMEGLHMGQKIQLALKLLNFSIGSDVRRNYTHVFSELNELNEKDLQMLCNIAMRGYMDLNKALFVLDKLKNNENITKLNRLFIIDLIRTTVTVIPNVNSTQKKTLKSYILQTINKIEEAYPTMKLIEDANFICEKFNDRRVPNYFARVMKKGFEPSDDGKTNIQRVLASFSFLQKYFPEDRDLPKIFEKAYKACEEAGYIQNFKTIRGDMQNNLVKLLAYGTRINSPLLSEDLIKNFQATMLEQLNEIREEDTNHIIILHKLASLSNLNDKYINLNDNMDYYHKMIKETYGKITLSQGISVLRKLPVSTYAHKASPLTNKIAREFVHFFKNQHETATVPEIMQILDFYTSKNWLNSTIYNVLVQCLSDNYEKFDNDQLIEFSSMLARVFIGQDDVIDELLATISKANKNNKNANMRNYYTDILDIAARVNLKNSQAFITFLDKATFTDEIFFKPLKDTVNKINRDTAGNILRDYFLLDLEKDPRYKEVMIPLFEQTKKLDNPRSEAYLQLYMLSEFGNNDPQLRLPEEQKEKLKAFYESNEEKRAPKKIYERSDLINAIEQLGHKIKKRQNIDGYYVDLYIPEQNIVVLPLDATNMCYDQSRGNYRYLLQKKVLDNLQQKPKVVEVKLQEFIQLDTPLEKVEFLRDMGIPDQNGPEKYDFNGFYQASREGKEGGARRSNRKNEKGKPQDSSEKQAVEEDDADLLSEEETL